MKFNGSKLLSLREKADMSREELAAKSSVSRSLIHLLETSDGANTTLNTVSQLAEALKVDPSDLIVRDADGNGEAAA